MDPSTVFIGGSDFLMDPFMKKYFKYMWGSVIKKNYILFLNVLDLLGGSGSGI